MFSNVKARGTWGEVTLGSVLEDILSHDQYARYVGVRPRSGQRVQYAIKLPGDGQTPLWLPVDAKYPAAGIHIPGGKLDLATPAGWQFEGSLSKYFHFVPDDDPGTRFKFLRTEDGLDVFLDQSTGRKCSGRGRSVEALDPPGDLGRVDPRSIA
jgi:hypothetical protein